MRGKGGGDVDEDKEEEENDTILAVARSSIQSRVFVETIERPESYVRCSTMTTTPRQARTGETTGSLKPLFQSNCNPA